MYCDSEMASVSRRTPEHRLLAGILLLAIQDFVDAKRLERWKQAGKTRSQTITAQKAAMKQAARAWILSNNQDAFSFAWICQHLNLHPVYIRKRILSGNIDMPNMLGTCALKDSYWAETGRVRDDRS